MEENNTLIKKMNCKTSHSLFQNKNKMKAKYEFDLYVEEKLCCGVIQFKNNKVYFIDFSQFNRLIKDKKHFIFTAENQKYPAFYSNGSKTCLLEYLFTFKSYDDIIYNFKNNNAQDLRSDNVQFYHKYQNIINKTCNVIECINGHKHDRGKEANKMKNPIWRVNENENEYLLMFCEVNTICKLCPESYQTILDFERKNNDGNKLTFYKHSNGYITTHKDNLYIHQVIMNCYGNGKGTAKISVDHIDRDPLNNTMENLRIATRKEQQTNTNGIIPGTKRKRSSNAKSLPEGIYDSMIKKYVIYYREYYDKEKTKEREYFKVEGHPKLEKVWISSKSCKVSIKDKLQQANMVVDNLEKDIFPEKKICLPKYVSLITSRNKPHLVFEKRINEKRLGLKMVLREGYDLDTEINNLNEKIKKKYEGVTIL